MYFLQICHAKITPEISVFLILAITAYYTQLIEILELFLYGYSGKIIRIPGNRKIGDGKKKPGILSGSSEDGMPTC